MSAHALPSAPVIECPLVVAAPSIFAVICALPARPPRRSSGYVASCMRPTSLRGARFWPLSACREQPFGSFGVLTHKPATASKPPHPFGAPGSPNLQGYAARAVVQTKCDSASGGSHACRTHSARDASFKLTGDCRFLFPALVVAHARTAVSVGSYTETAAKTPLNATAHAALQRSTPRQLT